MKYDKTVVCHTVTTTNTTHEYMIQSADIAFSFVYGKYYDRTASMIYAHILDADNKIIKQVDAKRLYEAVEMNFNDDVILHFMSVIFEKEVGR